MAGSESYLGFSQTSVMVLFVKAVNMSLDVNYFGIKAPSSTFEKVRNTPLSMIVTKISQKNNYLLKANKGNTKEVKDVKYIQSWQWRFQNDVTDDVLVSLLLALNTFHTFFYNSVLYNIWEIYEVLVQFSFFTSKTELDI